MTWNGAARSIGMSPGCVLTGAVFIFCIVIGWGECWASVMFVEHGCGRGRDTSIAIARDVKRAGNA
jgi:hypothetical protein